MQTKFIYASPPGSNSPPGDWFFEKRSLGEILDFLVVTDLGRKSILGFVLAQGLGDCEIRTFLEELVNQNGFPSGVYSNREFKIRDWCIKNSIRLLEGEASGGGVDALECSLIYDILHLSTNKYKKWRQSWPTHLKGISAKKKVQNEEFIKLLYESSFFQRDVRLIEFLEKGMLSFNAKQGITPTASSGADKVTIQNYFQRLFEEVLPAQRPLLKAIELSFLAQSKIQLTQLSEIKNLKVEQRKNLNLIKELVNYKNKMEEEKAAKESRRQKRLKRQKRQHPQPFLREYLPWVLGFLESKNWNPLTKIRLKLAMVLLVITGIRISEIRFIKVSQIVVLFEKNYLQVNLSKGGRKGHKIFLTKEGQRLLSTYRVDFLNLLLLLGFIEELPNRKNLSNIEPSILEFYLFSANSSKGQTPLSRVFFTNQINNILNQTPQLLERGIQLTSHSFRRGYITSLWKETKDLEFVRQVIAHKQIGTTSLYVKVLSDEERERRLTNL